MQTATATAPAGWADPARPPGLPPSALAWLRREVGTGPASVPLPVGEVVLPPCRLPADARAALAAVARLHEDDASRLRCAAGRSLPDLLRLRRGHVPAPPDAVVEPADADEVAAVLRACADRDVAVLPPGAGTAASGRRAGVVALDLRRLDRLVAVDPLSLTAVLEPGLSGPDAARLLAPHGLALGHPAPSREHETLGELAARTEGRAGTGHARFADRVLGLQVQTPAGPLDLAAGPDLPALLRGRPGALGVVTRLTLRVRALPEARRDDALVFRTWKDATTALRLLEQQGLAPDSARLSDPDETRVHLALAGGGLRSAALATYLTGRGAARGCLAVLSWEGTARQVAARRSAAWPLLSRALRLPPGGARGQQGRGPGPFLSDDLRDELLDAGLLVGTLETSATWAELDRVRSAVRSAVWTAMLTTPPLVLCRVSQLSPHGAALSFTVLARQDAVDPEGQWQRAEAAAAPSLAGDADPLGVQVQRAVEAVLDPTGVLGPDPLEGA